MTKKDGDRLRAMQAELAEMMQQYNWSGDTCTGLAKVHNAIEYALQGRRFLVHRIVRPATKSPTLPPAA